MTISPELLVTKGLLPENLPPVFTARNIWPALSPNVLTYSVTAKAVGDLCIYNASKRGGQRRLFGIPHPLFIKDQGLFFERHWADIEPLFNAAPGSVSRPILDGIGPRHVRITPHQDLPRMRLQRLSRFKFCLITDVSRFYPSVYMHSFPWAINGKSAAKADTHSNSAAVFGNRLDFTIRQAQSRQTIGMPVGPDASKIAAEILMSAVDKRFIEISGKSQPIYLRHVDDYWVGGNTHDECEKHLQNLRLALKEYQLDINEAKTRIISTKYVFGESWPSEFEAEIRVALAADAKMLGYDPISIFGKVVDRATRDNDDGIIRHVLHVIDDQRLWSSNWDIVEHFLAQCAVQFPHSFDYVARVIAWRNRTNRKIDKALWVEVTRLTAFQSGKLGRDSEVAWAIWLLKELKQLIPKALSDTLLTNSGSLVLSLLAHFPKHRLASDKKLYSSLRGIVNGDPFAGPFWPLTLELSHLAEGDPRWGGSSTLNVLRTLHDAKISIIDWDALPRVFLEAPRDGGDDDGPDYAIEDYGSDYGEKGADQDEGGEQDDAVIAFERLR
jgi:reverse transcriptase-like protein